MQVQGHRSAYQTCAHSLSDRSQFLLPAVSFFRSQGTVWNGSHYSLSKIAVCAFFKCCLFRFPSDTSCNEQSVLPAGGCVTVCVFPVVNQRYVICSCLRLYYTDLGFFHHGKKVANTSVSAAFLVNQSFFDQFYEGLGCRDLDHRAV